MAKTPKSSPTIGVPGKVRRLRLANLTQASYNPRMISDDAFRGLRESIARFGMLEMPVVNVVDGDLRLVSGHQRVQAMIADGVAEADCLVVHLDPLDEKIANLTMNNPAIRGTFDFAKIVGQIPDLSAGLPRPDYAAFDKLIEQIRAKADRMSIDIGEEASEGNAVKVAKPKSKTNTVYELGKHRLFCGDFVKGLAVLLPGSKKASACITDPPYNVDYESASGDSIENDSMTPDAWKEFIGRIASVIVKKTDGPSLICMSSKEVPSLARAWAEAGGAIMRWVFWVKDRFTLSRGDYHHQHEPILLGHRAGVKVTVNDGLTNVLECPKPSVNALHPTQKPVALIRTMMESVTAIGDLVIDPFSGSGTTIVVAEELGRRCIGCELDPRFADAIRRRWAEQVHGEGCNWTKLTPAVTP